MKWSESPGVPGVPELRRALVELGMSEERARKAAYPLIYLAQVTGRNPLSLPYGEVFRLATWELGYSLPTAREIVRAAAALREGRLPRAVRVRAREGGPGLDVEVRWDGPGAGGHPGK